MLHFLLTTLFTLCISLAPPTARSTPAPQSQTPTPSTQPATPPRSTPTHKDWTIDNTKREGIIYAPPPSASAATQPTPVIFAFHGHGGTARNAARTFALQDHWPEAIVVYLQGLPTPGAISDPKGERNGWQKTVGDQSDRDLKFFDAVLADLRKTYKIDDSRIYATGHSNGGAFTYLLWSIRGDTFAAVAPSAAGGNLAIMTILKPKPAMHIAGKNDTTVPFNYQQRIIDRVKKTNNCETDGKEWAKDCTEYPSKSSTPLVTLITDGTHNYNKDAPALIVKFFKQHAKAAESPKPRESPKPAASPAP